MASAGALHQQQQQVLWEGHLQRQQYGELTTEVKFAQPVVVTGVTATSQQPPASSYHDLPQLFKGYAKNLLVPSAAGFAPLFSTVEAVPEDYGEEYAVDQVFPTQHVFLRARCRSATLQLLGYAAGDAPHQIKATAEARFCPLPAVDTTLSLPSTVQQERHCQQHSSSSSSSHAPAPSLPRPSGRLLPLGKIPPAFVLTLVPLAEYWRKTWRIPLPAGSPAPNMDDLMTCEQMAMAVLASQRGSHASLQAKLSTNQYAYGLAVDWDGIRDSVLDMATYCCSALADKRTCATLDVGVAIAGVCAAILLAACQDGAAQFLSWPQGGAGVAGAIAVNDLVSMPQPSTRLQRLSLGLVDLLLESCPAIAGPALQGTTDPAGVADLQDTEHPVLDNAVTEEGGPPPTEEEGGFGLPAAKRQRLDDRGADAPADPTGYSDDPVAAASGLGNVGSVTDSAAVIAAAAAASGGPLDQALAEANADDRPAAQQAAAAGDVDDDDDAVLLAGLAALSPPARRPAQLAAAALTAAAAAGPRSPREQRQEGLDADLEETSDEALAGLNSDDSGDKQGGDSSAQDADASDPEQQADSDRGRTVQQQDDSNRQQQDEALQDGDYPEADEEAIKAEVAARRIRRLERRAVRKLARGQLYSAIVQQATSALQHDVAVSCMSVLRRLRAFQCLDVLQSTISPMMTGIVDAQQLPLQDFASLVGKAAAAASDLATLVLQPAHSKHTFLWDKVDMQAEGSCLLQQPQQEADYCVLQLMLSSRSLELLAGLSSHIGVHMQRLAQQQSAGADVVDQQQGMPPKQGQEAAQQLTEQQPQQAASSAEQQRQLCSEHAKLLDAIRALTASLSASSGAWVFLAAARDGLAALATAVCPTRQVYLDGGPFSPDTAAPYDPQHGWQHDRQQLLQRASGLCGAADAAQAAGLLLFTDEASAAAAGDLADSLQRVWLLVEATAELQDSRRWLSGSGHNMPTGAADKLTAAMKTLYLGGFASNAGEQSLVAALSANGQALRQLGVLLDHCGNVQAAAAGDQTEHKRRDSQVLSDISSEASDSPTQIYGALYAPEILLAVITSPHVDAIAAWLPLTEFLHKKVSEQLNQQDLHGAKAAAAAFPDPNSTPTSEAGISGVPTAVILGGAEAVRASSEQVVLQLHGAVLTAQRLMQHWQSSEDSSCSGSGVVLLQWLQQQLPELESIQTRKASAADEPEVAPVVPRPTTAAALTAAAADGMPQFDGAAGAGCALPPGGKDVKSEAVVEFMRNAALRSAALCALHLIDMLLRGAPQSMRTVARSATRSRSQSAPSSRRSAQSHQSSLGVPDHGMDTAELGGGFELRELLNELLSGGVLEVLDQALRTATVALRASHADLAWAVQGGSQQDMLAVLKTRTAAAALMRAACATTASLLLSAQDTEGPHLGESMSASNLLDAIICAHSAIVTCKEGLQVCVPSSSLSPLIAKATDPGLTPLERLAADAAVASASVRVGSSRVLMLLEARQALAESLRCWQLQGWWPDPVGALLGYYPRASTAAEEIAKEQAAARKQGDPSVPPAPPPRRGPRQLLSSLLGLADLCPEEWPPRGASQVAARNKDAADAEGRTLEGGAFECPSLILLRQRTADAVGEHWERLEGLITFGTSCSTRLARMALTRMLARMCGLGGGMSPLLAPQVLLALCRGLYDLQQTRKGLADRLHDIKGMAGADADKQHLIDKETNTLLLQLQGVVQVSEVLLPLCGAPTFKAVLTEHKAAGVLGKGVYALVRPLPELQQLMADEAGLKQGQGPVVTPGLQRASSEAQVLVGLLLQLVKVLFDPDISMTPWADRSTRELQDTPSIFTASITATWLLLAAPHLNPANMLTVAQLLVGPSCTAGAVRCLRDYPKGRAVLRRVGRQWQIMHELLQEAEERKLQARIGGVLPPPRPLPPQDIKGSAMTQPELQTSAEWAAAALESTQWSGGPDASHAAACAAIAQAFRELAGHSMEEDEAVVEAEQQQCPEDTRTKFIAAAKAAAAAHQQEGPDTQSLPTLLSSAPLLLACDAASLDFWQASAASAERAETCPPPPVYYAHSAARSGRSASSWWPKPQLVGAAAPRPRSQAIEDVVVVAQQEEERRRQKITGAESQEAGAGGAAIPVVFGQRSFHIHQALTDSTCGRKASMHVDEYQKKRPAKQPGRGRGKQGMPPPPPRAPGPGPFPGPPPGSAGPPGGGLRPLGPGKAAGQQPLPPLQLQQQQPPGAVRPPSDPRLKLLKGGSGSISPSPRPSPATPLSPTAAAAAARPGAAAALAAPAMPGPAAAAGGSDSDDALLGGLDEAEGDDGLSEGDGQLGYDDDDLRGDMDFLLGDADDIDPDAQAEGNGDDDYNVTEAGGL